jgi:hypothetical protein
MVKSLPSPTGDVELDEYLGWKTISQSLGVHNKYNNNNARVVVVPTTLPFSNATEPKIVSSCVVKI